MYLIRGVTFDVKETNAIAFASLNLCIRLCQPKTMSGINEPCKTSTNLVRALCLHPKLRHMLNCVNASYKVPARFSTLA